MEKVDKFNTLLTQTYNVKYEPSLDLNPYIKIVEHKLKPRLEEIHLRNRYRRSLSALLNSKATDPMLDKNHSSLNTLHTFEHRLQGKVSAAAPTKEQRNLNNLRQGRDPRMNEANAHFDRQMA